MTVLGSGNEKEDDKQKLVGKDDVATIMPNRHRLVKLQRKRSVITLILSIGFFFLFLCGIFLTVCYIKKIGPFRNRHFHGYCPVGSPQYNGYQKVYESYEITDKYALIHVPVFRSKYEQFDSVRTLHVYDKKITVIQHHDKCFVKPMMKHQMLGNDWFDKLRILSHHHIRTPKRYSNYYLRIVRPALDANYLRNEVHHLADAMCNSRPVFRLIFEISPRQRPWMRSCTVKCNTCDVADQVNTWQVIGGRRCRICNCKPGQTTKTIPPLKSSNNVDSNCKTIRCENKCVNKNLIGCVQCRCVDGEQLSTERPVRLPPIIHKLQLDPMIIDEENSKPVDPSQPNLVREMPQFGPIYAKDSLSTDSSKPILVNEIPQFGPINARSKRSVDNGCKVVAKIFEGYTPIDYDREVPLDYIYDC